jgi:hypothetical protein
MEAMPAALTSEPHVDALVIQMEGMPYHNLLLEPEEIVIIMHILRKKRKRNKKRKLWAHPLLESRLSKGAFYTLHEDLCSDERKFFNYYRMSSTSFTELYGNLKCYFCERDTHMRGVFLPRRDLL